MSSFTAQPSTSVFHSKLSRIEGGTLLYDFETTIAANTHEPALTVEFYLNTVKLSEIDINGYETRTADGSDYDYTYKIDASDPINSFFTNTDFFNPATPTFSEILKLQARLQVKIFVWSPNSDGVLTKGGTSTDSSTCEVLNALTKDLTAHTATTNRKMLTNQPAESFYVLGTKKNLSIVVNDSHITYCRVIAYDESNVQTGLTVFQATKTVLEPKQVAVTSINSTDIEANSNLVAGGSIDIDTASYFTVEFGTFISTVFTSKSELKKYHVLSFVYRAKQFHFQNIFGCQESITLYNDNWTESEKAKNQFYNKRNVGVRLLSGSVSRQIKLKLDNLDNEDFAYLKEIVKSALFYFDDVEYYLPNASLIVDDIESKNNIVLSFQKSIIEETHRN